ncbi:MAG TPA: hypothetical protein VGL55_17000 [Steroidobacteraceae bacterium]|jgi:hypothetical protein
MAVLQFTRAAPARCPRSPVLARYPIRRARLARLKGAEALELARQALQAGRTLACRGYLDEADTWRAMAQAMAQGGAS